MFTSLLHTLVGLHYSQKSKKNSLLNHRERFSDFITFASTGYLAQNQKCTKDVEHFKMLYTNVAQCSKFRNKIPKSAFKENIY